MAGSASGTPRRAPSCGAGWQPLYGGKLAADALAAKGHRMGTSEGKEVVIGPILAPSRYGNKADPAADAGIEAAEQVDRAVT
jgi:hypothetical protein